VKSQRACSDGVRSAGAERATYDGELSATTDNLLIVPFYQSPETALRGIECARLDSPVKGVPRQIFGTASSHAAQLRSIPPSALAIEA
jgi:hypothetical protein